MTQHRAPHVHHGDGHGHQGTHGPGHDHGHSHGPGHDHAPDWGRLAPLLESQAEVAGTAYGEAAAWLGTLVPASGVRRLLDVGSGPGVVTALLARAFPYADVVAVDSTPELLDRARAEAQGLGARVTTLSAELPGDAAALGEADLLWAGNSLHHIGDQGAALADFAKVLRPGGLVALVEGGLAPRHLPRDTGIGRPGLEARLDAEHADRFARMRAELPGAKREPDDWRALFTAAGLVPAGTRTFLVDVPAPVPQAVRELAVSHFGRLRESLGEQLDAEDRATLDVLLDPADERSLHHRTDLFHLTAHTVHTARKG